MKTLKKINPSTSKNQTLLFLTDSAEVSSTLQLNNLNARWQSFSLNYIFTASLKMDTLLDTAGYFHKRPISKAAV